MGWIRLHKKLLDWGWYSDGNTLRVFLHLLLTANFKPSEFLGRRIERGQSVFSLLSIGKKLCLSMQSVRTALEHLKSTGEISIDSTNKYSVATLINYELYNPADDGINNQGNTQPNNPATNEQQTTNKPSTTSEEYKKKEGKKNTMPICGFDAFYKAYPRKVSPHDARKAWDKLAPDAELVNKIMAGLERFIAAHNESLTSGKFTPEYPYPATWINKRRWEDGATSEPPQQKIDISCLEVK